MLRRLVRRRWFLVTILPIGLVVGLLALGELVCAILGAAPTPRYFQEEMRNGVPVLVRHEDTPRAEARLHPEVLPAPKAEGVTRILCLGGSTTHGHPFDPPGSFPDWLGVRLPRLLPEQEFEVWNLGANGFDMTTIRTMMEELWVLEPDLLVLYTGHNEFLDQNLGPLLHPRKAGLRQLLRRFRLGRLALGSVRTDRPAEARSAHGELFDEPFLSQEVRDRGVHRFERHLEGLLTAARTHQVPVLLCQPVSDLLDTPVRASSFAPETTPAARQEWKRLAAEFRARLPDRLPAWSVSADPTHSMALPDTPELDELLDRLTALDEHPAQLRYLDGWRRMHQLLIPQARQQLALARDQDEYPIRATSQILQVLEELGVEYQCVVVDLEQHLEQGSLFGVPGQPDLFVDYCHPNLEGHRRIADALLLALAGDGWCAPTADWQFSAEPDATEYRRLMGQRLDQQATGLARRALAVLANDPLGAGDEAARLVELALQVEKDCALAWATQGFLHCRAQRGEEALAAFQRAWEKDPECLAPFAEQAENHPELAPVFRQAGVGFDGLRPIRVDSP